MVDAESISMKCRRKKMKTTVFSGIVILAMAMLLAICGIASADVLPFQVPETQGISVTTAVVANGNVVHTDDLAWQMTTGPAINDPPLGAIWPSVDGAFAPYTSYMTPGTNGEIAMVNAYKDSINAQQGVTTLQKTVAINTANQVAIEDNVKVSKNMEFIPIEGGASRIVEDEEAMIDNMGQGQLTSSVMLCPFGAGASAYVPLFCNRVTMGSDIDMTQVSIATEMYSRSVAATADVPAELKYTINVKGPQSNAVAGVPSVAIGTVTARMSAHITEGRYFGLVAPGLPVLPDTPSEDVSYSTETTAAGQITQFIKAMSYVSGMRR